LMIPISISHSPILIRFYNCPMTMERNLLQKLRLQIWLNVVIFNSGFLHFLWIDSFHFRY
jgi:hypothetical protein